MRKGEDMDGLYSVMARFYDSLNSGIDYKEWADFAERAICANSEQKPILILDAACGTGSMTLELAKRGYDMTGVDLSCEMLSVARERAQAEGLSEKILFLCQDLGELDLYGTVDAAVCTLDSINHITNKESLRSFFSLLHRCFLVPGGVFVFDVNTPRKLECFYGSNDFILEDEGMYCGWQNYYDADEGIAHFYLSLFEEQEDGGYIRTDTEQEERAYGKEELCALLSECGFDTIGLYSDYGQTKASDNDDRWYFVCKNRAK